MPARCIVCKSDFNRAKSEDKLRCQKCQQPEDANEWKSKLKQVKVRKNRDGDK